MAGIGWQEIVILGVILVILAVPIYGLLWVIVHRSGTSHLGTIRGNRYAGFWHRAGGEVLDILILAIPGWLISTVVVRLFAGTNSQYIDDAIVWVFSLGYTVIGNGAGGTPGKQLARLRVVDASGSVPGIPRAAVRAVIPYGLRLISIGVLSLQLSEMPRTNDPALPIVILLFIAGIALLMALDYLWMIWDVHKQTLHDKLAGTFVVSTDV